MKSGSPAVHKIHWCEFVQFVSETESAGRISPPGARFSLGAELSVGLLYGDHKGDAAVPEVDTERVSGGLLQVAGGHVEHPHATGITEGNVRNVVIPTFVRAWNLAPHRTQHGQLAARARKDHIRVRDGVAVGVAHRELHRNSAATTGEYAAAVGVDWLQNDAARVGPSAGAIRNVQRPVDERDGVVR